MNSSTGRRSAQDFITEAQQHITAADKAQPCVAVTEANWKALISAQKTQIEILESIQNRLSTLATEEKLVDYMNQQLHLLREHSSGIAAQASQFRTKAEKAMDDMTAATSRIAANTESQAGRMSERFSQALSQQQEQASMLTKKQILISLIPTAVLIVWELIRHIWLLD